MRSELEIARSIKSATGVNPDLWVTVASRLTLSAKIRVCILNNSRVIVCILRGFNRGLPFRVRMTLRYFAEIKHRDACITGAINFDYRSPLLSSQCLSRVVQWRGTDIHVKCYRKSIIWFVKKETRALIRDINATDAARRWRVVRWKVERWFFTLKWERVYV